MPFEPGQSGNPNGRPKRTKIITQHLISELNEIDPATQATKARGIVKALIQKALDGDVAAYREIGDRVEGKPTQLIAGDEDGAPILARLVREIVDPKNAQDTDRKGIPAAS